MTEETAAADSERKREWKTPELIRFGSVLELTQGGPAGPNENSQGNNPSKKP